MRRASSRIGGALPVLRGKRGARATAVCLVAGLLALSFLLDPSAGSLPWLNFQKAAVKKDVREHLGRGIEPENLVVLRFSREEAVALLRWEHSREFEYDGEMYDVVETWTDGNAVYFRCFQDREETELNRQMRTIAAWVFSEAPKIAGQTDPRGLSSGVLFCPNADKGNLTLPGPSFKTVRAFSDLYSSVIIPPPTPPPRQG